ncbi:hypothetical protein EVA_11415 [gut metagenome]|uniref:Uncharacterized protein n=1 Tax=gut metagenome TaxID=749906 RepID=J9GF89_9ZZZZ
MGIIHTRETWNGLPPIVPPNSIKCPKSKAVTLCSNNSLCAKYP